MIVVTPSPGCSSPSSPNPSQLPPQPLESLTKTVSTVSPKMAWHLVKSSDTGDGGGQPLTDERPQDNPSPKLPPCTQPHPSHCAISDSKTPDWRTEGLVEQRKNFCLLWSFQQVLIPYYWLWVFSRLSSSLPLPQSLTAPQATEPPLLMWEFLCKKSSFKVRSPSQGTKKCFSKLLTGYPPSVSVSRSSRNLDSQLEMTWLLNLGPFWVCIYSDLYMLWF